MISAPIVIRNEASVRDAIEHPDSTFCRVNLFSVIDGFSPGSNTGNTLYHLLRSEAVRAARVPCRLWHWVTVKGSYYMGLVMVDSPGHTETVRIKLRGKELPSVRLAAGDGKRHLYLYPEPFAFEFAETLEMLTPPDEAPYVIEGVLFTPFVPEEKQMTLQSSETSLALPAFAPGMLPDRIRVRNPGGLRQQDHLVRFSLTVPDLASDAVGVVDEAGSPVPCDVIPLTRDPQGGPLTRQFEIALDLDGRAEHILHLRQEARPALRGQGLSYETHDKGVTVTRGERRVALSCRTDGVAIDGLADGRLTLRPVVRFGDGTQAAVKPEPPSVHPRGTLRVEVDVPFRLSGPQTELRIVLTFSLDPSLARVQVEHACTVLGAATFAQIQRMAVEIETPEAGPAFVGGETRCEGDALAATTHAPDLVRVETPDTAETWDDVLCAGNSAVTLTPALFRELYPAALRVDGRQIAYELLAPGLTVPPCDERVRDRLYFHVTEAGYKLKRGMMRRHRFLLSRPDAPAAPQLYRNPAYADVPVRYAAGCLWYAPERTASERYARFAECTLDAYQKQRDQSCAFGFLNFGDWFGERGENWGNGEYDTTYGLLLQYVRTGERAWLELGTHAARHLLEVDTLHASDAYRAWQVPHAMGHTGGYFPEGYRVGAYGPSPTPNTAHTWVEGILLYYQLTGDRLALATATTLLNDLCGDKLETKAFTNGRDVGWHLIHLVAGAAVLRSTTYLAGAQELVRLALARQRSDGSWRRVLKSDHCTCYPRHTGNAGFMVGVLLEGLAKYEQLTGDPAVERAIVAGGAFLGRELLDDDRKQFRYTSCPKSRAGLNVNDLHLLVPMCHALTLAGADADVDRWALYEALLAAILERYHARIAEDYTATRFQAAFGKTISKALRLLPWILDLDSPDTARPLPPSS